MPANCPYNTVLLRLNSTHHHAPVIPASNPNRAGTLTEQGPKVAGIDGTAFANLHVSIRSRGPDVKHAVAHGA
jgi:hypothetical protein